MQIDLRTKHQERVEKLRKELVGNTRPLKVKKKTASNLFRYEWRNLGDYRLVDLSEFDKPLYFDEQEQTLEVEGLATHEAIVDFLLPHGYAPLVTPELKHITIGGATVGIGIETNCFRYGLVHDAHLEIEVMLLDGRIVVATATNEYADLFRTLPNSYGSLGYILRVKMKVRKVKPYVMLTTEKMDSTEKLLAAMKKATEDPSVDYVENIAYSKTDLYCTVGKETNTPGKITSIFGSTVFFREISKPGTIYLTLKDYLFRYDPEWFWAFPETPWYNFLRMVMPKRFRTSAYYAKVVAKRHIKRKAAGGTNWQDAEEEKLIQDWELPWRNAQQFYDYYMDTIDLRGKPILTMPVMTKSNPTSYPLEKDGLYLNFGSYFFVAKKPGTEPYHFTKILDTLCYKIGGLKILYSSSFTPEAEFKRIHNDAGYMQVKKKYDPKLLAPTLYEKVVKAV